MKSNTATTNDKTEEPSNAFSVLLNTHRRGIAGHECSTFLENAIRASIDTGAKSEVNVKVTIIPGMDDQVNITIQPTAKLPQQKLAGAIFWVDENGKLVTSDPKQKELPIREVVRVGGPSSGEIREAKEA
jgi:hypothetical protein